MTNNEIAKKKLDELRRDGRFFSVHFVFENTPEYEALWVDSDECYDEDCCESCCDCGHYEKTDKLVNRYFCKITFEVLSDNINFEESNMFMHRHSFGPDGEIDICEFTYCPMNPVLLYEDPEAFFNDVHEWINELIIFND